LGQRALSVGRQAGYLQVVGIKLGEAWPQGHPRSVEQLTAESFRPAGIWQTKGITVSKSTASWVGRGAQLLDIRIEGLGNDQAFGEDCLLGVCFILGVPHHAQFLRVHDVPDETEPGRTVQVGTHDPQDNYADMLRLYACRSYETVDLTELGFPGKYVVMIHPFET